MRGISRYIALFMLLFFATNLNAQELDAYQNYRLLGVKYAWSINNISLQPSSADILSDYGYSAGLAYVFSNKKNVGLQLELQFSSRQWIEYHSVYQAKTELQYIELPLMTNIHLGTGRLRYLINLGTYFSFKIDQKKYTNLPQDTDQYESFINRTESGSDFGLLIGGGLRYISSMGVFQFDARYAYGYQKLYNEEATGFRYSNMSVISLNLAYMFNLKKNAK